MQSAQNLQKAAAPSTRLLRFLRAQSDEVCFFKPNPRAGITFDHAVQTAHLSSAKSQRFSTNPRHLCTFAPVPLESNLLSLEFLRPRATKARSQVKNDTRSARYVQLPRGSYSNQRTLHGEAYKWLKHLWGYKQGGARRLRADDLPLGNVREDSNENMFSVGRNMLVKTANEPKLRCTEFNENGDVVLVNSEFKKTELIAKYGLLPRDLRKIDSSLLPHILVRPSAILINLLHLRCLIKHNRVLLFDTYGSANTYTQSLFVYDLENKLKIKQGSPSAGGLPYEFRALESVLISVTSALETEFEGVREPVVRVLRDLEEDIDRDKLRHLLIYSKKLGTYEQKAKLVRDAIDELLEADDDLAAMYLTEKAHDIKRGEDDHTEVEMLLESYHKVCDEIVQVSGNLVSNIRNTEEIVKAILDANRNSLMLLDLKFSIGTLGMGSGAFVAALYGMNLKNFIEESDLGFLGVSAWSFMFAVLVCSWGLVKLRKVQRVSMWGEDGRLGRKSGRGSWRNTDDEVAKELIESGRRERTRRLREERIIAMSEKVNEPSRVPLVPTKPSKTSKPA